jgi:hypothetical protein
MCPLCVMSAILLVASAGSAGGINWLAKKRREKDENATGAENQGLRLGDCCGGCEQAKDAIEDEDIEKK